MIMPLSYTSSLVDLIDRQNFFIYLNGMAMRREAWRKTQTGIESLWEIRSIAKDTNLIDRIGLSDSKGCHLLTTIQSQNSLISSDISHFVPKTFIIVLIKSDDN